MAFIRADDGFGVLGLCVFRVQVVGCLRGLDELLLFWGGWGVGVGVWGL